MGKGPSSIFLFLFCLLSSGLEIPGGAYSRGAVEEISVRRECGFSRYPELCIDTMQGLGHHPSSVLHSLVEKTRDEITRFSIPIIPKEYDVSVDLQSQKAHANIGYCQELMDKSLHRLNESLSALQASPPKYKQDIQTWLSAVLTFHEACKDSVSDLPLHILGPISTKMDHLSKLASNSLALANRISPLHPVNSTARRLLSDENFPTWVSRKDRKLLQINPATQANVIVAQDGTGDYEKISDAIKAAKGERFVIFVKSGVYKEKINVKKHGITLIGEGKYTTIITGDDSFAAGATMPDSATFAVSGDGFIARDIGFQNAAGTQGKQALAVLVNSDGSVFYRCSFIGYQDTLYAVALRQFYRECDIHGTIDFIFGNAAAIFQKCNIFLRRPGGATHNVILANGRTDPGQNTGFILQHCRILAGRDLRPVKHLVRSFLGRPWKKFSRAVVMRSKIDDAISEQGWDKWEGTFALKTLYFAEYENEGPGAGISRRVKWSGHHIIGLDAATRFTADKFIGGNSWLPITGVIFDSGL